MSLKQTVRKKYQTHIQSQMDLRKVTNLELTVEVENGDLLANSRSILKR
jgi:hypothetical protein